MTPEERSLLERTYKLVEENNVMLRKIRRANHISAAFRIGYWVIIIGITLGTFYFLQPYIDSLMGTYRDLFGVSSADASTFPTSSSFLDMLK